MKIKKLFMLFSFLTFFSLGAFAAVDVEIPAKIIFAYSDVDLKSDFSQTVPTSFPLPFAGPARVLYLFDKTEESRWTFGLGGSTYVFPFQTIAASASAAFNLLDFKNGNSLEIFNVLDAGYLHYAYKYFDSSLGRRTSKHFNSFCAEYNLSAVYRWKGNFKGFVGFGPQIGITSLDKEIFVFYGININLGYRFL